MSNEKTNEDSDVQKVYPYCERHFIRGWSEYTFPANFIQSVTPCVVCGEPSVRCSTEKADNFMEYANRGRLNFSVFFIDAIPKDAAYGMATFYGTDKLHTVIDFLSNLRAPFVVDTVIGGGYIVYTIGAHLDALREFAAK